MLRWRIGALAAVVALAACSLAGKRAGETDPQGYVNREAHFSFLVPRGWQEKKSWNPFRRPPDLVRFGSSSGDAAATATSASLEGRSCLDAGRGVLDSVSGATLSSPEAFAVKTSAVELAAAQGETSANDRRGRAKLFCEGDRVIVLEVSANTAAYGDRKAELVAILDSFTYLGASGETLVAAPRGTSDRSLGEEVKTPKDVVIHPSKMPERKPRTKAAPPLPAVIGPR